MSSPARSAGGVGLLARKQVMSGRRYDPSELESFLRLDVIERQSLAPLRAMRCAGLQFDPAAVPPADKFFWLGEIEPRFVLSWQHRRPDFVDQSLPAYDQSLAAIAARAGWTAQEIVNLLIAHRRKYGGTAKALRQDYVLRTAMAAARNTPSPRFFGSSIPCSWRAPRARSSSARD